MLQSKERHATAVEFKKKLKPVFEKAYASKKPDDPDPFMEYYMGIFNNSEVMTDETDNPYTDTFNRSVHAYLVPLFLALALTPEQVREALEEDPQNVIEKLKAWARTDALNSARDEDGNEIKMVGNPEDIFTEMDKAVAALQNSKIDKTDDREPMPAAA